MGFYLCHYKSGSLSKNSSLHYNGGSLTATGKTPETYPGADFKCLKLLHLYPLLRTTFLSSYRHLNDLSSLSFSSLLALSSFLSLHIQSWLPFPTGIPIPRHAPLLEAVLDKPLDRFLLLSTFGAWALGEPHWPLRLRPPNRVPIVRVAKTMSRGWMGAAYVAVQVFGDMAPRLLTNSLLGSLVVWTAHVRRLVKDVDGALPYLASRPQSQAWAWLARNERTQGLDFITTADLFFVHNGGLELRLAFFGFQS